MAIKPIGPEYGAVFTLASATDTAVFNEEASGNYVGILDPSESSGLDSAEVREDNQDRTEEDGSIQGLNFFNKRPIILAGLLRGSTATQRSERATKLMGATMALRSGALLTWTPAGGLAVQIEVRRNQRLIITGGWAKKFQAPLMAADPRIYSQTLHEIEKAINVVAEPENQGNYTAPLTIELVGPQTNPVIENETTGQKIKLTYALASGHTLKIDTLNHTVFDGTTNAYSAWKFTESTWFGILAGAKPKLKCTTGTMKVKWRDTWM